jgi:hypothetical protein
MANTVDADLYGKIVGENALRIFQAALKPLSAFSTDFSDEIGNRNSSIVVPVTADPTDAADKVAGSDYTIQDTTVAETSVTLNKHKVTSGYVTDNDVSTSRYLSVKNVGIEKGQQLAIDVFQDIASAWTNANFGAAAFTGAASTFDHDDVIDLQTTADTANWPEMDGQRHLLLSPSYYNAIFKDAVVGADVYGAALVAKGEVPELAGFRVHKCNAIPGNSENLVGLMARPNAMAIVNRYLAPAGGGKAGSIYNSFTHPETGLTIGYREFYDDDAGVRKFLLECWYGYSVGVAAGAERLVSA